MGFKTNGELAENARSHIGKNHIVVGSKYRITNGRYIDRLCKIVSINAQTQFAVVTILDAWGKETKEIDAVPQSYLER